MGTQPSDPRTLEQLAASYVEAASASYAQAAKKLALTKLSDIPRRIARDTARANALKAMIGKEDS